MWRLAIIGLAAGGLSGLLGVGGGILMVPAFSTWLRMPLKETVATSLACVGVFAIPGTITHALLGHIDWAFAIPLCIGVIPGARIGANFTIAASDRVLRLSVAGALAAVAADLCGRARSSPSATERSSSRLTARTPRRASAASASR